MILRLEHIGIAVEDGPEAQKLFDSLLGRQAYRMEKVNSEGVNTIFYQTGQAKVELLEATQETSPIKKFLGKRGPGIHHLAFEVDDIEIEMQRLRAEGFQLLNEEPKRGADNKLICFLHPKSTGGVLVELCQSIREH